MIIVLFICLFIGAIMGVLTAWILLPWIHHSATTFVVWGLMGAGSGLFLWTVAMSPHMRWVVGGICVVFLTVSGILRLAQRYGEGIREKIRIRLFGAS